jgi:hypothetical protein
MSSNNNAPTDTDLLRLAVELNREQLKELKSAIPPSHSPSLMSLVSNLRAIPRSDELARIFCIQALGQTGEPAVLSSMLSVATSRSREIRKAVAIALANIHHPLSAYLLLPMLLDTSARVRKTAMRALMHLGQPFTAESILAAATSDLMLQQVFSECLQQLGWQQQKILVGAFEAASGQTASDTPEDLHQHLTSPRTRSLWENYSILSQSADVIASSCAEGQWQEDDAEQESFESTSPQEYSEEVFEASSDDDATAMDENDVDTPLIAVDEAESVLARTQRGPASRSYGVRRSSVSKPVSIRSASTLSVSRRTRTARVTPTYGSFDNSVVPGSVEASVAPVANESAGSQDEQKDTTPAQQEPTYSEWFYERFLKTRSATFVLAFYLHVLLLLLMATVYLSAPESLTPFSFNAILSDEEYSDTGYVDLAEAELDFSEMEMSSIDPDVSDLAVSTKLPIPAESTMVALPSMFQTGEAPSTAAAVAVGGPAANENAQHQVPAGAITAGSFSVWTVPDNPDPGEPYKIVIQMRVPDGTDKYSISDLEGVVVGSDGYQKMIPGGLKGFLPVINGKVQMEVHIVSADEDVEDTVFIRSRLLREAQRLQIRF